MTERELKRLSRADLLEMLLTQSRRNKELQEQLEAVQTELDQRRIMIENAGSIAEASLQLNGVFAAAQEACRQYIENIQERSLKQEQETAARCKQQERETAARCKQQEQETAARCEQLKQEAEVYCSQLKQETKRLCEQKEQETKEKCEQMVAEVQRLSAACREEEDCKGKEDKQS